MTTVPTHCPLDCPDACSLTVEVEGDRVASVDGAARNAVTAGYICAKVRRFPEALHGPDRILTPLRRTGPKGEGRFEPIGWEDALRTVAERLAEARDRWGGESILPLYYGGSNGLLSQNAADARLFRRLGASRLARTVCAAATGAAASGLYGAMPGVGYADYAEARLILVWGANPSASGFHLVPAIREARRRGATLVVVDPRRIPLARGADLHLPVRPGTDLPLALALHRWLFHHGGADAAFLADHATGVERLRERAEPWTPERAAAVTGVDASAIERVAMLYRDASPALVRCGWGPERNRNGGSAIAAILALPAVAGKFGVRGGGYTLSNSSSWELSTEAAVNEPPPPTRLVNMNHTGRVLLEAQDPPVKVAFVYNHNPVATLPDQERVRRALAREDLFTVVFDSFLTDTALYADVVLPATTFLERRELSRGYGAYVLQDSPPAIPPVGESRTNHEVFTDLVRRLGLDRPGEPATEEEFVAAILRANPRGAALASALGEAGIATAEFGAGPVQFVDVFPRTPDGRVHLVPEALDREAPRGLYAYQEETPDPAFPLALISPATAKTVNSTLAPLAPDLGRLEIHPADAAPRGLRTGDLARAFNALGEVLLPVAVSEDLRPGVVLIPKGLWARHTRNGATANALAPDTLSDVGANACFNDARVEVERAEG